jgi:hypothetical protein
MRRLSPIFVSVLLIAVLVVVGCTPKKPSSTLKIDKDKYLPNEVFTVTYVAPAEFEKSAWIGIIPSGIQHGSESTNDKHDLTYQYLNKSTSGQFTFRAPSNPGSYDLRMHDTDNNGKEVASVTFTVVAAAPPPPSPPDSVATEKALGKVFKVRDLVKVNWKGSWWSASVIKVGKNSWKIHYDGYNNSWDEWVGPKRIRKR